MSTDGELSNGGDDPWFLAWKTAEGKVGRQDEAYFYSFLMDRALRGVSNSSAKVIVHTFNSLYTAIADDCLPEKGWDLISWRLPWSAFAYDQTVRLSAAVVERFISQGVQPTAFLALSDDDRIFQVLVEVASSSYRGRAYLRKVRQSIADPRSKQYSKKYALIGKKL